jgi:hypothetical protein
MDPDPGGKLNADPCGSATLAITTGTKLSVKLAPVNVMYENFAVFHLLLFAIFHI